MNYPRTLYINCWLEGKFSKLKLSDPNPEGVTWCKLDIETWGRILEAELNR